MYVSLNDIVGQRFGKLTVVQRVQNNKYGHPMVLCSCECGSTRVLPKGDLIRERYPTQSCTDCARRVSGRTKLRRISDAGLAGECRRHRADASGQIIHKIRNFKNATSGRGIELRLSNAEILDLMLGACSFCGHQDSINGVGIDRTDSNGVYKLSNVTSCCKTCNFAKHTLTTAEFTAWVTRVHNYLTAKEGSVKPLRLIS